MKYQIFSNNATGAVGSILATSDTEIQLQAGDGVNFPVVTAPNFAILGVVLGNALETIAFEVVKCTGKSGDTLTIERSQENTIASSFPVGAAVYLINSAATIQELNDSAVLNNDNLGDSIGSNALGLQAGRTLSSNTAIGEKSLVFGYDAMALLKNSMAMGEAAQCRVKDSINISGGSVIRRDNGELNTENHKTFAGFETVYLSNVIDLRVAADDVMLLSIPVASSFYTDEVGVILTQTTGVVSNPSISFGTGINTETILATTPINGLVQKDRDIFKTLLDNNGNVLISASVKVAANATAFSGRFYIKGMLIED